MKKVISIAVVILLLILLVWCGVFDISRLTSQAELPTITVDGETYTIAKTKKYDYGFNTNWIFGSRPNARTLNCADEIVYRGVGTVIDCEFIDEDLPITIDTYVRLQKEQANVYAFYWSSTNSENEARQHFCLNTKSKLKLIVYELTAPIYRDEDGDGIAEQIKAVVKHEITIDKIIL